MTISINTAISMFREILNTSGADTKDVETMLAMLLDGAYSKNRFSPFTQSELEFCIKQLNDSIGVHHELVVDKPSVKLINGNKKSAILIGMEMVDMVCDMAQTQGIGVVGLFNSTYHNAMGWYGRMIAQKNLIGLVFANGGPASVTPFGGSTPIMGTNPLSYAIPTRDMPIVFDGATGQYAYGTIRLAKIAGKKLPPQTYIDAQGAFTTDPTTAIGLIPFGGYKGYAINLMIEILTGTLVRAKMGFATQNEQDLGSLFIALDPSAFQPIDIFKKEVSALVFDILKSKSMDASQRVHVPGYSVKQTETFTIPDELWKEFNTLYTLIIKNS